VADIIAWDQNKWAVCQNLLVPLPNEYKKIKKNIIKKHYFNWRYFIRDRNQFFKMKQVV